MSCSPVSFIHFLLFFPLFSLFSSNTRFCQSTYPLFISSNFSLTSPNISPQISCRPIHTIVLPYIFLAIPFSYILPFLLSSLSSFLPLLVILLLPPIFLQSYPLILLHSLNPLLFPTYHSLL